MLRLEINKEFIKEFNDNIKRITDVWYSLQDFKPYASSKYYKGVPLVEFPNYKCDFLKGYEIDKNYIRLKDGHIYWTCEISFWDRYEKEVVMLEESFMPQSWFYKSDEELIDVFKPILIGVLKNQKEKAEDRVSDCEYELKGLVKKIECFEKVLKKLEQ